MADEAIGEAATATAAEGGAVLLIPNPEAEAAESGEAPSVDEHCAHCADHDVRITDMERRLNDYAILHQDLRTQLDSRALSEHEHAVDEDVRIVADELKALREEEVAPRRGVIQRGWLRKLGRGERSA